MKRDDLRLAVPAEGQEDMKINKKFSPEEHAFVLSKATFSWVGQLFTRSTKKRKNEGAELDAEDLFDLMKVDSVQVTEERFYKAQSNWLKRNKVRRLEDLTPMQAKKMLMTCMFNVIRGPFLLAGLLTLMLVGTNLAMPVLIKQIITFISTTAMKDPNETMNIETLLLDGVLWAGLFVLAILLQSVLNENASYLTSRSMLRIKSVVSSMVFRKSLALSSSARNSTTNGEIVNHMQLDGSRINTALTMFHPCWSAVLIVGGQLTLLYLFIGPVAFISLGVLILIAPVSGWVGSKLDDIFMEMAMLTDERVKLTSETLTGIQAVKFAAWEGSMAKAIFAIRDKELHQYFRMIVVLGVMFAVMAAAPVISSISGIIAYAISVDGDVDASILFSALASYASIVTPISVIPMAIPMVMEGLVGLRRIGKFITLSEAGDDTEENAPESDSDIAVEIEEGEFAWKAPQPNTIHPRTERKSAKVEELRVSIPEPAEEENTVDDKPVLMDVNLCVKKGELVAIAGPVGSGKTSLISAILGDMYVSRGTVFRNGTFSYAAQTAWILNGTIRENILFGEPMNTERYRKVLKVCQLTRDLEMLKDGDMTMIGERGTNLSGGQRQRVSIARAAYSSNDIVILDDPLSALDPEVASKVFSECITKFLSDRTCILVTNQLHFLPRCDRVVLLGASSNDKISTVMEQGRYTSLMRSGLNFAKLMKSFHGDSHEEKDNVQEELANTEYSDEEAEEAESELKAEGDSLVEAEERAEGAVRAGVYLSYIGAAGGIFLFVLAVLPMLADSGAEVVSRWWVSFWTEDTDYERMSLEVYLIIYGGFGLVTLITQTMAAVVLTVVCLRASRAMHNKLLQNVLHAPMRFFDTTPLGRIIQRFSNDMDALDSSVPQNFMHFLQNFTKTAFVVGSLGFVTLEFLYGVPVLIFIYILIINRYRPVKRDIKRITALATSPLYAHFNETLSGIATIRAFNCGDRFRTQNQNILGKSISVTYCEQAISGWLNVRMGLLSALIALGSTGLVTYMGYMKKLEPGLAGLALTSSMLMSTFLQNLVISFASLEASMNSVERIQFYTSAIKTEAPYKSKRPPPNSWPSKGTIEIANLELRYHHDGPLILKGVTAVINGGERVGIVGRTGAGKSSFLLALMRIVEPERVPNGSGPIAIDGIDICKLGLHELRGKISIVPQFPVLFSGTVRSNVDPFKTKSDDEIWDALRHAELEDFVQTLGGLDGEVAESGGNFSQGQRQLLSLSRSILVQNKILLLDEATSAIDFDTDVKIQKTLRSNFSGCTVLTIAHRLNTVIDSDRIMVMEDGKVAEFDSPAKLVNDPRSKFSAMVNELGSNAAAKLRKDARRSARASL